MTQSHYKPDLAAQPNTWSTGPLLWGTQTEMMDQAKDDKLGQTRHSHSCTSHALLWPHMLWAGRCLTWAWHQPAAIGHLEGGGRGSSSPPCWQHQHLACGQLQCCTMQCGVGSTRVPYSGVEVSHSHHVAGLTSYIYARAALQQSNVCIHCCSLFGAEAEDEW